MFQWNSIGVAACVATAMCWALALVLYRTGLPGSVARRLSLLLGVEGVTLISSGYLDLLMAPATIAASWYPAWFQGQFVVHTLGDCAMFALYPPFLAAALNVPMTRPFARSSWRLALAAAAAVLAVLVLATPMTVGATTLYVLLSALFLYALVASINAWRTAVDAARARARSFAFAFGIRDLCWGWVYADAARQIWGGTMGIVPDDIHDPIFVVYLMGTLLAVPLIAYGILRTQLFDIDLRIRWTLKQSTLAGAVVAILFLVTEAADRLLTAELGDYGGLLAVAVIVFFLAPLQRFAERVAATAMPNTRNTPEYVAFRKMQVYEAAVAETVQDGGISIRERRLLDHLRESLGISSDDAAAIEAEMLAPRSEERPLPAEPA